MTGSIRRPFLAAHEESRGMPPYHPAMMLKVLLYGYASGVRSSRRIEERLGSDVGFMFLAGQARSDHKTIGEFRRRHLAAFSGRSSKAMWARAFGPGSSVTRWGASNAASGTADAATGSTSRTATWLIVYLPATAGIRPRTGSGSDA